MKLRIFFLILIVFLVGIAVIFLFNFSKIGFHREVTLPGSKVSKDQIIEDIKLMSSKDLKIRKINFLKDKESQVENRLVIGYKIKREKHNYGYPYNVQEAIKLWLYLEQREPEMEITELYVEIDKKWVFSGATVHITKEEFEGLLEQVDRESYSTEELIEELTFMYIEQYNYPRWWEINREG